MNAPKSIFARLRRRFASSLYLRDILLQASGNTAAQVLGIAFMPILTRLYAPTDFAALYLFTQVVTALAILMTLRFEYLVMLPVEQRESDSVLKLTLYLGGLHVMWLTPFLWLLPGEWSWLKSQGAFADWIWLAPLSAWAVSTSVGMQQAIQRRGDFRSSAISELIGRGAYVTCSMFGTLALPSIFGLMASTLANAGGKLAWLLGTGSVLKSKLLSKLSGAPIPTTLRRMALSTSVSSLISLFPGVAPMIFIANYYGADALGKYGLVVSTLFLPSMLIGQSIGQVYYQRACRLHGEGLAFTELLVDTSFNLAKMGVPLYALIALLAPLAYPLLFGAEWQATGEMARWLCLAAAAGFISTPLDRTSIVVGAWWYLMSWNALRALSTCVVLLIVSHFNIDLQGFIAMLSVQMAFMYFCDLMGSLIFTRRVFQHRSKS